MGALTKLFLKLLKVFWHWFALFLQLLDFACHAFHVQELCNAVINLHTKKIRAPSLNITERQDCYYKIPGVPRTHCTLRVLRPFA